MDTLELAKTEYPNILGIQCLFPEPQNFHMAAL